MCKNVQMITRRLQAFISQDLQKKMVLLAGPRQCGKTSLAKNLLKDRNGEYYNWDIEKHRMTLLQNQMSAAADFWVFDEIHKYRRWRNWLKGIYDEYSEEKEILVTGSAKLDAYSRGGDSLQGRYFFHRLHPFTLAEVTRKKFVDSKDIPEIALAVTDSDHKTLQDLLLLGGFPEPFQSGSKRDADRWRLLYGTRLLREEVSSLERVIEIDKMELLYQRLPEVIQSSLSVNGLREDLQVAHETVKHWLSIFENLYLCFQLPPFGPAKLKAVQKEQKLYFWDWSRAPTEAARLENLVATHLLRLCHWIEDVEGQSAELRYFRTRMGHEVNFIVLKSGKPWLAIEVKTTEQNLDPNLKYYLERVKTPFAFQLHLKGKKDWQTPAINGTQVRILPAAHFLAQLP